MLKLFRRGEECYVKNCEVLVIGGGIIGCSIAYYASKYGRDVTIIEKGEFVSGTSSRCDGNILAIDKDPGFDSQMSLFSQNLVDELSRDLEHSFEYRAPGSILVCESDEEMEAAQKWVDRQKEAGLPFRMLDRQDIRQDSPFFEKYRSKTNEKRRRRFIYCRNVKRSFYRGSCRQCSWGMGTSNRRDA
jgi:sarcosine oxidase subunit beta